jgi:DNA primase
MDDSAKYLIRADITADGVVERSDVVGAVFGQTEGLLGEELDLRDLQQSSKVGRIDVQISSQAGRSTGEITIASSLDRVETAILAAALETIDRVGPCRAKVEVSDIEDVRAAKRREVVERAKELLSEAFDESVMDSSEILEDVRGSVRVEAITDYRDLPAGPRVEDSDSVIVVEGRADVLTLLRYGVKNAVAVEGTNVPDAVASLTEDRTVTAFLDGDRGGELILRELRQVGDVDYVAFAPEHRSVEDLARDEVMAALRGKVAAGDLADEEGGDGDPGSPTLPGRGGEAEAAEEATEGATEAESTASEDSDDGTSEADEPDASGATADAEGASSSAAPDSSVPDEQGTQATEADEGRGSESAEGSPSLREHTEAVIGEGSGRARLLDEDREVQAEVAAEAAFDALTDADSVPFALVLDATLPQRVLDVAAQRGVAQIVARETGEFVKKPVDVRVRTADQLLDTVAAD